MKAWLLALQSQLGAIAGPFTRGLALFLVLNVAVKLGWVLMDNVLQDRIGHAAYGQYAAVLQLCLWLTMCLELASSIYLTLRFAPLDVEEKSELIGRYHRLRIALSLVYVLITALSLGMLGYLQQAPTLSLSLLGAALLLNWLAFVRLRLQLAGLWQADAWASVADKAVLLLLGAVWVLSAASVEALGLATLLSALVCLLTFAAMVAWRLSPSNSHASVEVLRASLPLMVYGLALAGLERMGQIAVEQLCSPIEAGLYAGAFRWTSAALMGVYLLQPWFLARFSKADEATAERLLLRGLTLFACGMALIAAVFISYPALVLQLLKHSTATERAVMAAHLHSQGLALWVTGLTVVMGTYLTSRGALWPLLGLTLGSVLLYLLALMLALPSSAAWASPLLLGAWAFQGLGYLGLFIQHRHTLRVWRILLGLFWVATGTGTGILLCAVLAQQGAPVPIGLLPLVLIVAGLGWHMHRQTR